MQQASDAPNPNPSPNPSPDDSTAQRLIELEIKASYTEDLLDQLDKIIVRQQQQIDALIHEMAALRQPVMDGEVLRMRSLRDELPPHF